MGTDAGRRRRTSRMVTLACAGILLLLPVSACAAEPTPAPTSAPPTAAPAFATDEEALAAAEEAYAGYIETADLILTEGGAQPERIERYVSGALAETEIQSFQTFHANGLKGTGVSTFSNMTIQTLSDGGVSGEGIVSAYVCSDVSGTDVLNSAGQSTVPSTRQLRTPFLLVFDLADPADKSLVVSSATVWDGDGVCDR